MEENNINENVETTMNPEITNVEPTPTPAALLFEVLRDWGLTNVNWLPKVYDAAYMDFINRLCDVGYLNRN